ncbi:hypothetical protein ACLMJK_001416 [Lecanora helva]
MESRSHDPRIDSDLPSIRLVHTHNEYFHAGDTDEEVCEIPVLPSARFPLAAGISSSLLLPLYDPSHVGETYSEQKPSDEDFEKLREAIAVSFLCGAGQLLAFSAGRLPIILIDPGVRVDAEIDGALSLSSADKVRSEFEQTFSVIHNDQRPHLHFVEHLKHMKMESKQKLLPLWVLEDLINQRCIISPQVHFSLGSKQALFESNLTSPRCEIIEFKTLPSRDPKNCCNICRDHWNEFQIPRNCTGPRKQWLDAECDRALQHLLAKPLPYLIKLQQTMGGNGTRSARNPRELVDAAYFISQTYLPNHLPRLTEQNVPLQPMNLVLSDIVDYVAHHAVNFFLKNNGDPVFVCVAQEMTVKERVWVGDTITYSQQSKLEGRLGPTMRQVSAFLHSKGYYGPVALDVLEDKAGVQWVVDLNVRTGGSYILGTLKKHFVDNGLDHASLLLLMNVKIDRRALVERFFLEFQKGNVIIVAWYEKTKGESSGYVAIGAKMFQELRQKEKMFQELSDIYSSVVQ